MKKISDVFFSNKTIRNLYRIKWIGIKIYNNEKNLIFKNCFFKKNLQSYKLTCIDMSEFIIELYQNSNTKNCLSDYDIQTLIKTKTTDLEKRLLNMFIKLEIKDAMLINEEYCMFLLDCANKFKNIFEYDFFKLIYPEQIFDFLEKNCFSLLKEKDFLEYIFLPGKTSSYASIFPVIYEDKIKNFIIFHDKKNKKRSEVQISAIKYAIKELSENINFFHKKKIDFLTQLKNLYKLNNKLLYKNQIEFNQFTLSDITQSKDNINYERIKILGPDNLKTVIQKNTIKTIDFKNDYINIMLKDDKIDENEVQMLACANIHFEKSSKNIIIPKINCDINDYIIYDKI
jgi:hypothetical protein